MNDERSLAGTPANPDGDARLLAAINATPDSSGLAGAVAHAATVGGNLVRGCYSLPARVAKFAATLAETPTDVLTANQAELRRAATEMTVRRVPVDVGPTSIDGTPVVSFGQGDYATHIMAEDLIDPARRAPLADQPNLDWRGMCQFLNAADGFLNVVSHDRKWMLSGSRWVTPDADYGEFESVVGCNTALAAAPPYPGALSEASSREAGFGDTPMNDSSEGKRGESHAERCANLDRRDEEGAHRRG